MFTGNETIGFQFILCCWMGLFSGRKHWIILHSFFFFQDALVQLQDQGGIDSLPQSVENINYYSIPRIFSSWNTILNYVSQLIHLLCNAGEIQKVVLVAKWALISYGYPLTSLLLVRTLSYRTLFFPHSGHKLSVKTSGLVNKRYLIHI